MIQTQHIVIKTSGTIKEELQQLVSGIVVSKQLEISVSFLSSAAFEEQFKEYLSYDVNFIKLKDIITCKTTNYMYNPCIQQDWLNEMKKGDDHTYFIYEALVEFKRDDMSIIEFIRKKSEVHAEIFKSVHVHVFPQLDMVFNDSKINVGLLYNEKDLSEVYNTCIVDVFNYIDVSNIKTSLSKVNITKYDCSDELLIYIMLSMCDMVIGDCYNILSYESSFGKKTMIHNVGKLSMNKKHTLVPSQIIYNNECMFPNSQLLLKYI